MNNKSGQAILLLIVGAAICLLFFLLIGLLKGDRITQRKVESVGVEEIIEFEHSRERIDTFNYKEHEYIRLSGYSRAGITHSGNCTNLIHTR